MFTQTPLYTSVTRQRSYAKHLLTSVFAVLMLVPSNVIGNNPTQPYWQQFVVTGYYSALEGQSSYAMGGYKAEKIMNGQGTHGADGTPVYSGMLAAPPAYAFGTVIDLGDELGVGRVNDRGGAIQVLNADTNEEVHRLDIWFGHGPEALARAVAFGKQTVTARVYPKGSQAPEVGIHFNEVKHLAAVLEPYDVHSGNLMSLKPAKGESSRSVMHLQDHLKALGYFNYKETATFGDKTQQALATFIRDYELNEPTDRLTVTTAAYLMAARHRHGAPEPVGGYVNAESSPAVLSQAQRILRYLGYYNGRTDGVYNDKLFASVLRFQQDNGLVGTKDDPGAGHIGPITMRSLQSRWNQSLVGKRADRYMTAHAALDTKRGQGKTVEMFLGEGNYGPSVKALQEYLAEHKYFPKGKANGNFGPLTKAAVAKYQVDNKIVNNTSAPSAGYVGRKTLTQLRKDQRKHYFEKVMAEGWEVL